MSHVRDRFRALHEGADGFILPNAWDAGSARILASLGFAALATTSSGHAATLGRLDGEVSRDEALEHASAIVKATPLPVSADLEHCFATTPGGVAETIALADATGLAGCSIEDWDRDARRLYEADEATQRVAAAVEAARRVSPALVITARAENHIRGNPDLADTISRLQRYQEQGADVLYAPGLRTLDEVRALVAEVDRPVNVLPRPGGPTPRELLEAGARRVSLGGALSLAANAALLEAGRELIEKGTLERLGPAFASAGAIRAALAGESPG